MGADPVLGARVLAELGDDRARFPDARALKSYAGSRAAPQETASQRTWLLNPPGRPPIRPRPAPCALRPTTCSVQVRLDDAHFAHPDLPMS
ncbi:transposase [Actinacidiphila glaucinigra]|uniref:transposase n=1 Tax=Actinacidiphila glaucinigra TaxID=235986 RepID=UPI0038268808